MSVAEIKRIARIRQDRIKVEEYSYTRRHAVAEVGTTIEDVVTPRYWGMIESLRKHDLIVVTFEDREDYYELRVTDVGKGYAKVKIKYADGPLPNQEAGENDVTLPEQDIETGDYVIKFLGPIKKFSIIDKQTKAVVFENIQTKKAAEEKLAEHVSKLAA